MILATVAMLWAQVTPLSVGTSWGGTEVLRFENQGEGIEQQHQFRLTYKIVGKTDGTWDVDRGSRLVNSLIDGTSIPPMKDEGPAMARLRLSPRGFLLFMDPWDGPTFAVERLIHFWMPAGNVDGWQVELNTTVEQYANKATASFRPAKGSRGGMRNYSMKYVEENGFEASGNFLFDIKSGRVMFANVIARNATMPGGIQKANISLAYVDSTVAVQKS